MDIERYNVKRLLNRCYAIEIRTRDGKDHLVGGFHSAREAEDWVAKIRSRDRPEDAAG